MSDAANTIQIQEPPVSEFKKKRSCLRRSCLTGLGCIVLFLMLAVVLFIYATSTPSEKLKKIPESVSKTVPIYDEKDIENITFRTGRERSRLATWAAVIPKLLLSPFIAASERRIRQNERTNLPDADNKLWLQARELALLLQQPVTDRRDAYLVEWTELPASAKFIEDYYRGALTRNTFTITKTVTSAEIRQIEFAKGNVSGELYIKDDPQISGTAYVALTIHVPQ